MQLLRSIDISFPLSIFHARFFVFTDPCNVQSAPSVAHLTIVNTLGFLLSSISLLMVVSLMCLIHVKNPIVFAITLNLVTNKIFLLCAVLGATIKTNKA